ncbi:MAG TPA: VCBS repeat-containing protein, partial [Gemmatimonadaceae bacterium]
MSSISVRSRLSVVAITGLALLLCALGGAGSALAVPGGITNLASPSHPDAAAWYADPNPSFTWSPLAGVVGYSYALDHSLVSDPATAPVSMPAVAFAPRADVSAGARPWGVTVADLNGDGHLDLASANRDDGASVMLGNGDGTFAATQSYDLSGDSSPFVTPHSVAAG